MNKENSVNELINEAINLTVEKKSIDTRLKQIKSELEKQEGFDVAQKINTEDGLLHIVEKKNYHDIAPKDALMLMKKANKADKFAECVKIVEKSLLQYIGADDVKALKKEKASTMSWSFKKA